MWCSGWEEENLLASPSCAGALWKHSNRQNLTCLLQVRSLSSFLEMEGYDRPPFSSLQLESFHQHVTQRLEQEKDTLGQVMVRNALFETKAVAQKHIKPRAFLLELCPPAGKGEGAQKAPREAEITAWKSLGFINKHIEKSRRGFLLRRYEYCMYLYISFIAGSHRKAAYRWAEAPRPQCFGIFADAFRSFLTRWDSWDLQHLWNISGLLQCYALSIWKDQRSFVFDLLMILWSNRAKRCELWLDFAWWG